MSDAGPVRDPVARAEALVSIFHADSARFGRLRAVDAENVPPVPRRLLDHDSHMTVAMETFHGGPVGLRVLAERTVGGGPAAGAAYAREIVLVSPPGLIVQHGIVRIDLGAVAAGTAAAIRAGREPLGRILIAAGLLREVGHVRLLEIEPGPHLRGLLTRREEGCAPLHGRVADIRLDGRPAIELLEIVTATEPAAA